MTTLDLPTKNGPSLTHCITSKQARSQSLLTTGRPQLTAASYFGPSGLAHTRWVLFFAPFLSLLAKISCASMPKHVAKDVM